MQTRSDRFGFLVTGSPIVPQYSAKIKPGLSSRDVGKNKFWNDTLLLAASKFVPQNLQFLFWLPSLAFFPRLQTFVGVADITFISSSRPSRSTKKFRGVFVLSACDTFLRKISHAEKRAPDFDWWMKWQLLTDKVIGLTENRWAGMKRVGFLWQAFPLLSPQCPSFFLASLAPLPLPRLRGPRRL